MFTHCFLVILLFEVRCWQVTVNSPPGTEYALNKRYPNIVCALFFLSVDPALNHTPL